MRTRTIGITVSIGLALAVATVLQARSAGVTATAPRVAPAGAGGHDVAAEGRVVTYPGAEVRVSAERGGRLVRLDVQEGDRVQKGQMLGEIESEELRAALAEARGRVSEAEAEVRLAELNRDRRRRLLGSASSPPTTPTRPTATSSARRRGSSRRGRRRRATRRSSGSRGYWPRSPVPSRRGMWTPARRSRWATRW